MAGRRWYALASRWPWLLLVLALTALSFLLGSNRTRAQKPPDRVVRVYFPDQKRTVAMPLEEYLVGVVAAEMPGSFHDEALKAQVVVARTYTVRRLQRQDGTAGCPLAQEADICASPEAGQAYIDEAQYQRSHGWLAAKTYWRRLRAAVNATRDLIITYQGHPIDALYHSDSIGSTASAREYFGADVPYLQAVTEPYGMSAPRAKATLTMPLARVAAAFGQSPAELAEGVTVLERTASGRVASMRVGDRVVSGREFRERLGLNSTDFTDTVHGDALVVTTLGYGHGVGMSQYGANEMAAAGADFRAIIRHYYAGVQVEPLRR